jgi:hypothetical protein
MARLAPRFGAFVIRLGPLETVSTTTLDPRARGLLVRLKLVEDVTTLCPRITWLGEENSGGAAGFLVITVTPPDDRIPAFGSTLESRADSNPAATLAARTTEPFDPTAVLVERITFGTNWGGDPVMN